MALGYTDPTVDEILNLTNNATEISDIEPLFSGNKLTKKEGDYELLRNWITTTHTALIDTQRAKATTQIKNLALWMGLHYKSQGPYASFMNDNDEDITLDSHKIVVNNIYDVERNRYSKITRNTPQTRPVPKTTEYEDFAGAKIASAVLKTIKDKTKQKRICNDALRHSFLFGESWIYTGWDKDKGKIDPRWKEALDSGKTEIEDEDGEKITISKDKPIFIGDHKLQIKLPWTIFCEPKATPQEVSWIFEAEYVHIDELRYLYPEKKNQIVATDGAKTFNVNSLQVQPLKNHALVYTLHARSDKFIPEGIRFVCTPSCTLEKPVANPNEVVEESEWGNLPYERLTDIDVPGRLDGYSTVQILASLQHSENQMHTMIKHYLLLMGHPKMLIPEEGNIEVDEFSDDSLYIRYSGGRDNRPELMVPNPIPAQIVAFAEMLRDRIQKLGDLHGVSSGDLPNQVKAAKAIRLLQELEDLRATSIYEKYNQLFVDLDRKSLSQTKNYRESDGRLSYVLGKGNEYLIEDFDPEIFSRNFGVELEIQGMLPQQPSARAEFILEAQNMSGNTLFTNEKMVKLLGMDSQEEFIDASTVSVIKANRENDMFIKGKKVNDVMPYENHLVEVREHLVMLQSASFGTYPPKVQEKVIDHTRAHEMFLWFHMQENPMFMQYMMQTQTWFPAVFKLPKEQPPLMGPPAGAAPQQEQPQPTQEAA